MTRSYGKPNVGNVPLMSELTSRTVKSPTSSRSNPKPTRCTIPSRAGSMRRPRITSTARKSNRPPSSAGIGNRLVRPSAALTTAMKYRIGSSDAMLNP